MQSPLADWQFSQKGWGKGCKFIFLFSGIHFRWPASECVCGGHIFNCSAFIFACFREWDLLFCFDRRRYTFCGPPVLCPLLDLINAMFWGKQTQNTHTYQQCFCLFGTDKMIPKPTIWKCGLIALSLEQHGFRLFLKIWLLPCCVYFELLQKFLCEFLLSPLLFIKTCGLIFLVGGAV